MARERSPLELILILTMKFLIFLCFLFTSIGALYGYYSNGSEGLAWLSFGSFVACSFVQWLYMKPNKTTIYPFTVRKPLLS